ncbi:hypothetical protein LINPERHAP2_LOCUS30862, partial [Linum perenne]
MSQGMGRKYVFIVRWGGEILFTSNGVEYAGGLMQKIKAKTKLSLSELVELITESIQFDEHEKPAYLTYRMPSYTEQTTTHIPIVLGNDEDVEMIYESMQNNPDIQHAEVYVETITSESWDHIGERLTEVGKTRNYDDGGPSAQNEGPYNVDSDSTPPPSDRNDSSDESEECSSEDTDGHADPTAPERQHMPPTEHYTMINTPVYATSEIPEIPDIPHWDPSRDFSKGMIFQTKKDVQAALKHYALER